MMKVGPAARLALAACALGIVLQPAPARAQQSSSHLDALQQLNGSVAALVKLLTVSERPHDFDRLTDLVDPEKSLVARLGILGVDVTEATANLAAAVRVPRGVVVVGHTASETPFANAGLMTADTIHAINNQNVTSVDDLRAAVAAMKPRSPVVLQIERSGQFLFLAFELD